jgi:hypothetical protein
MPMDTVVPGEARWRNSSRASGSCAEDYDRMENGRHRLHHNHPSVSVQCCGPAGRGGCLWSLQGRALAVSSLRNFNCRGMACRCAECASGRGGRQSRRPHRGALPSCGQARTYHAGEFASQEANYWASSSRPQRVPRPARPGMGLQGAFGAEHFAWLIKVQHAETKEQTVRDESQP